MYFVCWTFWLLFQVFFPQVENHAILLHEENETGEADLLVDVESYNKNNDRSQRGLLDILENFRQWQVERRRENPAETTQPPTPEPTGYAAFLPRLPGIKLDQETFMKAIGDIRDAGQDWVKAFVGPPPTTPAAEIDESVNGTNITATVPSNELFCFLC